MHIYMSFWVNVSSLFTKLDEKSQKNLSTFCLSLEPIAGAVCCIEYLIGFYFNYHPVVIFAFECVCVCEDERRARRR